MRTNEHVISYLFNPNSNHSVTTTSCLFCLTWKLASIFRLNFELTLLAHICDTYLFAQQVDLLSWAPLWWFLRAKYNGQM